VKTVMVLWLPKKVRSFVSGTEIISVTRRLLLLGDSA
jgi:hypothetical protein